jgi:NADP-dependent 3-hydroxy acid dehydrogenase YdfG
MEFTPTLHLDTYDAISPTLPSLSTKGKSVLITGGGYGIGAFAARSFCLSGASRLALIGRRAEPLAATVSSLKAEFPGTEVSYYATDVTDPTGIAAVFEDFGAPDVLVNNAGIFVGEKRLKDIDIEEWWKNMEVNVKGVAIVTQQYLRKKKPEQKGVVLMLNSVACHWGKVRLVSFYPAEGSVWKSIR